MMKSFTMCPAVLTDNECDGQADGQHWRSADRYRRGGSV